MFETLRNAFKIKELRKRIGFTFLMLVIIRLGSQIPAPGVSEGVFDSMFGSAGASMNFFDAITGGSLERMSIFCVIGLFFAEFRVSVNLVGHGLKGHLDGHILPVVHLPGEPVRKGRPQRI